MVVTGPGTNTSTITTCTGNTTYTLPTTTIVGDVTFTPNTTMVPVTTTGTSIYGLPAVCTCGRHAVTWTYATPYQLTDADVRRIAEQVADLMRPKKKRRSK
jgi:hypothetical protein